MNPYPQALPVAKFCSFSGQLTAIRRGQTLIIQGQQDLHPMICTTFTLPEEPENGHCIDV
ncbi:hypothetical protein PCASD_22495 [Puccinia coronata f. sp. avenae]|uniref:Uncharacterized protein n=1 Tax=Puccinia coronata f. sp. avenae TaxID=200324 RepID=A0A2N5TRL8_9BASI|nr:hypothetical protein PCASD_22495 [Puccinia coronata f. sp. avenae]